MGPIAFTAAPVIPGYVSDARKPSFRTKYNTAAHLGQPELVLYAQYRHKVFGSVQFGVGTRLEPSPVMVHREAGDGARSLDPPWRLRRSKPSNVPTCHLVISHIGWVSGLMAGLALTERALERVIGAPGTGDFACGIRYFRLRQHRDVPWCATRLHLAESTDRR
jgi:hypothetical protein